MQPTRFRATASTLIDNIIYKIDKLQNNNNGTNKNYKILISDVSDHLPILYLWDYSINRENIIEKQKFTNKITNPITEKNVDDLSEKLSTTDWTEIFETNDANSAYEVFYKKFTYIYNECIPNVIKRMRIDKKYKPLLSKALLKSIRKKNKLYQDSIKNKCEEKTLKYKYKNKLIKNIKSCWNFFISPKDLNMHRETLKNLERNKNVIKNGSSTFYTVKEINIHKILSDKPYEIAMTFNNYFANIGPELANKIDLVPGSYPDYIKACVDNTMYSNNIGWNLTNVFHSKN